MINWQQNPNWKNLPKPEVGDIVQLKLTDVFDYLVKAIVTVEKGSSQKGSSLLLTHVEKYVIY